MHAHDSTPATGIDGWLVFEVVAAVLVISVAAGYAWALWTGRRRSAWPVRRTVFFYAGLVCVVASLVGPLAQAAHGSFTAHMTGHLLLGMIAPLLLVLSAPVSALLRALPVGRARAVSRILRLPYIRVVTHPVVAALLNAGGLWVLYTTPVVSLDARFGVGSRAGAHSYFLGGVCVHSLHGGRGSGSTPGIVQTASRCTHSVHRRALHPG